MGSQTSRNQALSDAHHSGIPGVPPVFPLDLREGTPGTAPITSYSPTPPIPPPVARPLGCFSLSGGVSNGEGTRPPEPPDEFDKDELIPCVFTWSHGGRNVFLTGSFNEWSMDKKIRLFRSGHEFTAIKYLPRAVHMYKFIVDEQWKFAPDQPTQTDQHGNVNNVLDISHYKHPRYRVPDEYEQAKNLVYHQFIPDAAEMTTDAPSIPILLSKSSCAATLPSRSAVSLQSICNHMYHDSHAASLFGPHVCSVATTLRWRADPLGSQSIGQRHATTIYVTLNPFFPTPMDLDFGLRNPLRSIFPSKNKINNNCSTTADSNSTTYSGSYSAPIKPSLLGGTFGSGPHLSPESGQQQQPPTRRFPSALPPPPLHSSSPPLHSSFPSTTNSYRSTPPNHLNSHSSSAHVFSSFSSPPFLSLSPAFPIPNISLQAGYVPPVSFPTSSPRHRPGAETRPPLLWMPPVNGSAGIARGSFARNPPGVVSPELNIQPWKNSVVPTPPVTPAPQRLPSLDQEGSESRHWNPPRSPDARSSLPYTGS